MKRRNNMREQQSKRESRKALFFGLQNHSHSHEPMKKLLRGCRGIFKTKQIEKIITMKKLFLSLLGIAIFILVLNTISIEPITPQKPLLFIIQTIAYLFAMVLVAFEICRLEEKHTHNN